MPSGVPSRGGQPGEASPIVDAVQLEIELQEVTTPEEAEGVGFGGSPTILFDGVDLFADSSPGVGYACRLYRTASGAEGARSLSNSPSGWPRPSTMAPVPANAAKDNAASD